MSTYRNRGWVAIFVVAAATGRARADDQAPAQPPPRSAAQRPQPQMDPERARQLYVARIRRTTASASISRADPGEGGNRSRATPKWRRASSISRRSHIPSSIGDLDIPAYLFQPLQKRGAKGHAALVWVHGGVHGDWSITMWPFVKEAVDRGALRVPEEQCGGRGGYRVSPQNRLSGLIDYTHVDREQVDYPEDVAVAYGLQWRNSSLRIPRRAARGVVHPAPVGLRARQHRRERRTTRCSSSATWPASTSNLDQTRIRLVLDSSPIPFLYLGSEGYWKYNDYRDNHNLSPLLGRTKDTRQEYYASISYGDVQSFRVTFFGDIEFIQYDSDHRNINAGTCPGTSPNCFNPNSPPTSIAYNWSATNKDTNWALGIGTDWKAMERLTLKGSAIWSRTLGNADIVSQNNFGNPIPIPSYDTTSKVSLNLKGSTSTTGTGILRRLRVRGLSLQRRSVQRLPVRDSGRNCAELLRHELS